MHHAYSRFGAFLALSIAAMVVACRPADSPRDLDTALLPLPSPVVEALAPPMTAPHVVSVAPQPPEHVLPTLEAGVSAAGLSGGVQELRTWTLTPADRIILYARAGVPVEYIPILEAIGSCESSHSPGAVGDSGNSLGWYQIWTGWFREGEDPYDPATNLAVALRIRETRGRWGGGGGWTCADRLGIV